MSFWVYSNRLSDSQDSRAVKKIKLKLQGSPLEPKQRDVLTHSQKTKKILFNEEPVDQISDEASQPRGLAAAGGEDLDDKDYTGSEWALQYVSSSKKLVLIVARSAGPGKLAQGRTFSYGRVLRVDYEDPDSMNMILLVDCSKGVRKIFVLEDNLVKANCGPQVLREAIEASKNLIPTLRPYINGHVSFRDEPTSPPKAPPKKIAVQRKPQKKKIREESDSEVGSSNDDEEERITPGGELASGVLSSEQNKLRREIMKKKLVRNGQVYNLPITHIHRPPVDPITGRRPMEIREPHKLHVQNLKRKMKINPHATVVPFIVLVDPDECDKVEKFDIRRHDQYNYFVIGGSHSAEARRQLIKEHPTTYFFKYAECKIYVGLTVEEAKLLAWDHNNDNDYRQKMSSIERIRFFHHEYLDALQTHGPKLFPALRRQCLYEVGIVIDDTVKSDGIRKYESWFQLAFRDGEVWDLQDKIFTMWENKEVNGQKQKKSKVDPQLELHGSKARKIDLTIEEAAEDMKLTPWRSLQGIKDETLLVSVLSRVVSKELSLDEMVTELNK